MTIKLNNDTIPEANITFDIVGDKWLTVYANFTKHHLRVGTYTISAVYKGDDFHKPVQGEFNFALFSRDMNISVSAESLLNSAALESKVDKVFAALESKVHKV